MSGPNDAGRGNTSDIRSGALTKIDNDMTAARGAFFDQQAKDWSRVHYGQQGGMLPRIARFADALGPLVMPGADILDYGCGTGEIAVALAARGYRVEACDMSAKMIEQARENHAASSVQFMTIAPPAPGVDVHLPMGERKFDAIVCSSVLEYVHDLPASLQTLAGSLKPGGWLLATVPDIDHPVRRSEKWHRWLMQYPALRALIRFTPVGAAYRLQWLSHNRFPVADWSTKLHAVGLGPVWQDCQHHPLILLVGQRKP